MDIDKQTAPQSVVDELTGRLARFRIESGITQAQLAELTGVSKRTIERIENGFDTQLTTLIRLLQALDLADRLNQLVPESTISPMKMLQGKADKPKRARNKKASKTDKPWKWGDEK